MADRDAQSLHGLGGVHARRFGARLLSKKGFAAHAAIPVGFLAAAFLYSLVPADRVGAGPAHAHERSAWVDWRGWTAVFADRRLALWGAFGTAALAVDWIPDTLWPMIAGAAAFGLFNARAELALLRDLGEVTPRGLTGRVVSVARVGTNSASVALKGLMAAAFAAGAGVFAAFSMVGAGLGVLVAVQLSVAARLGGRREA